MDEFSLIDTIKQRKYYQASLQRGIGDDAAVIRETANDLVVAIDTFVENVHFSKTTMNPEAIGYRALAANFSDLAAMGASPQYYLVSIVVPDIWKRESLMKIYEGMKELAGLFHADLIGGDTVAGNELVLTVTVIGKVEGGKARYRSAARPGDVVFVTGTLGDSRAGLHMLQHKAETFPDEGYFISRHQKPMPRVAFARAVRDIRRLALNDISDGIGSELHEIAEESNVSLLVEDAAIPVHPGLQLFPKELQDKWKLFGGEDFELVGTVSQAEWPDIQHIADKVNVKVTLIGSAGIPDEHPVYLRKNGKIKVLPKEGYTHLK